VLVWLTKKGKVKFILDMAGVGINVLKSYFSW
jgi:hypothetical protein